LPAPARSRSFPRMTRRPRLVLSLDQYRRSIWFGDLVVDGCVVVVNYSSRTWRWRTNWLEEREKGGLYVQNTSVGTKSRLERGSRCWRGMSDMQINQVHDMWLNGFLRTVLKRTRLEGGPMFVLVDEVRVILQSPDSASIALMLASSIAGACGRAEFTTGAESLRLRYGLAMRALSDDATVRYGRRHIASHGFDTTNTDQTLPLSYSEICGVYKHRTQNSTPEPASAVKMIQRVKRDFHTLVTISCTHGIYWSVLEDNNILFGTTSGFATITRSASKTFPHSSSTMTMIEMSGLEGLVL
ncbi:hypothetical protein KCU62_g468, partial [Aureobasidium sp. EXF-3399]